MQVQDRAEGIPITRFENIFSYRLLKLLKSLLRQKQLLTLLGVFALAIPLRFYQLGQIPAGLNVDEASAGYDSYSLLLHGTDRWGNPFPIYFPSWGSGQNVLLSYLNIPFVKIFGLTPLAVRLLPAILSLLTILVLYKLVQKLFDTRTGLIAAFLLCIMPWHIMMSRWSLESDLLPCFLLLGAATLVFCYESQHRKWLIPFSLAFFAVSFYAYATSVFVIPIIIGLYIFFNFRTIWEYKFSFLLSIGVFLLIAFPFSLFLLDNYVLHSTPEFVKHLPFTVPLLISSRLNQVSGGSILWTNIHFVASGFNDGLIWNTMPWYAPLGLLTIPLACIGIYYSARKRQLHGIIFVLWLVAALPMFLFFDLNLNRANAVFIPLTALSAVGLVGICDSIEAKSTRTAIISVLLAATALYSCVFCYDYFNQYNNLILSSTSSFNVGFPTALNKAISAAAPGEPIYVSDLLNPQNSAIYALFYLKADPLDFQRHSHVTIIRGIKGYYRVDSYRNFYFLPKAPQLAAAPSYVAILKGKETVSCSSTQVLYSTQEWTVERCFHKPTSSTTHSQEKQPLYPAVAQQPQNGWQSREKRLHVLLGILFT